jgi:hypothetical protein
MYTQPEAVEVEHISEAGEVEVAVSPVHRLRHSEALDSTEDALSRSHALQAVNSAVRL